MTDPRAGGSGSAEERPGDDRSLRGRAPDPGRPQMRPAPIEPLVPDADEFAAKGWRPTVQPAPQPADDARLAPWALFAAVVALATSMFVGWGIPVAVVAVIAAIMSLRRPTENRSVAMWALVLGLCATLFSAGWLLWATTQFEKLG